MIVYLDASALVKRYIAEAGSTQVEQLLLQADAVGTSVISRAEVSAALAKAVRVKLLARDEAAAALQVFRTQWADLVRLQLAETIVARTDSLAWGLELRGYDAVHLAVALFWQDTLGEPVNLATFHRQLWEKASAVGLAVWPENLDLFTRL